MAENKIKGGKKRNRIGAELGSIHTANYIASFEAIFRCSSLFFTTKTDIFFYLYTGFIISYEMRSMIFFNIF